ncbi:MAG: acyl-CoA dehydrogenase family protein [Acidimicrobiales bacterium]
MDFDDSPEEARLRAEARAWLESVAPLRTGEADLADRARSDSSSAASVEHVRRCREWQAKLYEGGWAGITWPREYGGRGGTSLEASIFAQEQARFDVSAGSFAVAVGMVGPTLIAHGTDAQKARYLAPILRGEEVWCQLFSEPGAGSDLAGLACRAVSDGDEWVVDGQKVWTSGAQHSELAILLARTDPGVPKHRGLSYFILDMATPGVEVRPLRQISGVAHFNEVFLNDVRIPDENRVGEVNGGWTVALTTLANERTLIGSGGGTSFDHLRRLALDSGAGSDARARQRLAESFIRFEVLRYLGLRVQTAVSQGRSPGPESSVLKLAYSLHVAELGDLGLSLEGARGALIDADAPLSGFWQQQFLGQWSIRIGGGTDQIQRNVIGERVLGLPTEPRSDKSVAFRALPR